MTEQVVINKYDEAFVNAQSVIENPELDSCVKYGNTEYWYASLGAVLKVVKKAANQFGLYVTQYTLLQNDRVVLVTRIAHISGEFRESTFPLEFNSSAKNQEKGSAITYARRYSLCSIFGITGEDDDDAMITLTSPKRTEIKELVNSLTKNKRDEFKLLIGYNKSEEIPDTKLDLAIRIATALANNKEVTE